MRSSVSTTLRATTTLALAASVLLAACSPTPPAAVPTAPPPAATAVAKTGATAAAVAPTVAAAAAPATTAVAKAAPTIAAALAKPAQDLGKITLGLSVAKTFEFLPAYVAEDRGTWKKRGLNVEIVTFAGDAPLQQAFAANSIDVGLAAASGGLSAISKGLDTRLIGAISNKISLMGLVVNPEAIKSRDDLKGKTIGVTSPNSVTDTLAKDLSKKLTGDAETGIRRAALGGLDAQIAALKTGQTQGFVWTLEGIFEVEKQGIGKFLLTFGDEFPDFAFETIIARKQVIEQRSPAVQAFLEGWYEAVAYMKANKEYTLTQFQARMDTPPDIGARVYDVDMHVVSSDGVFVDKALEVAADTLVRINVLKEIPPQATWVDKRFLPVKVQ